MKLSAKWQLSNSKMGLKWTVTRATKIALQTEECLLRTLKFPVVFSLFTIGPQHK